MQVNRPATVGNGVFKMGLVNDVLLPDHVVTLEASTFPLAGDVTDPLQGHSFRLGKLAGVLDVIPDTVNDFPEFPFDLLGLMDGVHASAVLDPPEVASLHVGIELAVARDLGDVLERPVRGGEVIS